MYVCLTNRCHGNCNYCPEKKWFSANEFRPAQDMSLELFNIILHQYERVKNFTLCGGEVLLYPYLDQALTMAGEAGFSLTVCTSLLGDSNYLQYIVDRHKDTARIWDVNIDFIDERKGEFIYNLWQVLNKVQVNMFCTLGMGELAVPRAVEKITAVLDSFANEKKPIITLDTELPVMITEGCYFDFTPVVRAVVENITAKFPGARFNIRQCLATCELNRESLADLANLHISDKTSYCSENDNVLLPDGSVRWCFAMPEVLLGNITEYRDAEMVDEMKRLYKDTLMPKFSFPKKCRQCENFNPAKCFGVCFAKVPI